MGDDVAVVVHDEDRAAAHAGFGQPAQDAVERDDGSQHSAELVVHLKRDGHDEGRAVIRTERQRIAAEDHRLGASLEGALQGLADEGVLVGAEVAGAGALGVVADGGQVEKLGVLATKFSSRRVTCGSRTGSLILSSRPVRERIWRSLTSCW